MNKILIILLLFTAVCRAQTAVNNCECGKFSTDERNQILSSENKETTLLHPNGKLKYKETRKGRKAHIICYSETGKKCREIYSNSRTGIKKTIHFNSEGKKQMVCKGKLNY